MISPESPFIHPNGCRWTGFAGYCSGCDLDMKTLHGSVEQPYASVFVIDATGTCSRCGVSTRFRYRLHDDGSVSGRSPKTGEWSVWKTPRRLPWWRRFLQAFD